MNSLVKFPLDGGIRCISVHTKIHPQQWPERRSEEKGIDPLDLQCQLVRGAAPFGLG